LLHQLLWTALGSLLWTTFLTCSGYLKPLIALAVVGLIGFGLQQLMGGGIGDEHGHRRARIR
jgi:hypothetical protein